MHLLCLRHVLFPHCAEREGAGNRLERTSGAGGVSHMRSVYKVLHACVVLRSVSGGRSIGGTDHDNEDKMDGFNDHNFLPLFIDKYRELPCLWQVKHPQYNNKQKRQAVLEKLLELVTPVVPTATIPYLKAKIGGLRSTYLRERKKVMDSQRSGAAADDIYVPRLWYYERLRFLSDQTGVRESLSTLPSTLPSTPAEASNVQPGTSSQEEMEEPSWSQV
ncbi:hypothetical protein AB205_0160550 [Aquarana catesbeiana]|uniref:MADF domain-containing protein n=1 Tax=Aquarana catesbeiana TaxID=8400 RepID=A0A2G9QE30_AQUCT|nr:hypothetical protein AB205_0160550 [Aquarana catesbeiana]